MIVHECMSSLVTFLCLGQDSSKISVSGLQIWPDHSPKCRYRFVVLQLDDRYNSERVDIAIKRAITFTELSHSSMSKKVVISRE